MINRLVVVILATLCLLSILASVSITRPDKTWLETIYIRADGSIDPPDAPITTYDNITYTLTDDINCYTDGIVVQRNNIILNGANHIMQGNFSGRGIILEGISNVTIREVVVTGFSSGIYLRNASNNFVAATYLNNNNYGFFVESSSGNSFLENNVNSNRLIGVWLNQSSSNLIYKNNITKSGTAFIVKYIGGICIYSSSSNNISQNNVLETNWHGIGIYMSSGNVVSKNKVERSFGYGILINGGESSFNQISENTIINNGWGGICLEQCLNNYVSKNFFYDCGLFIWFSRKNIVEKNTVNDKPLIYLEDLADQTVNYAGQVILINCNNITVEDLNLYNATVGIQLWYTSNTRIMRNNISNMRFGIFLFKSSNNSIFENNVTANNDAGIIFLSKSDHNNISRNIAIDNMAGIYLYYSDQNIISENIAKNNNYGIWLDHSLNNTLYENTATQSKMIGCCLYSSLHNIISQNNIIANNWDGICLSFSNDTKVFENNSTANGQFGIQLSGSSTLNFVFKNNVTNNNYSGVATRSVYDPLAGQWRICEDNVIFENNIEQNQRGIWLEYALNNTFFHNNILANTEQVYDRSWDDPEIPPSINNWDAGYPLGGNHWSDYNGTDIYHGPKQIEIGGDGVGDHPYVVNENNTDHYPLKDRWPSIDIAIIDIEFSKQEFEVNKIITINVNITNKGKLIATFDVGVNYSYIIDPAIGTQPLTLLPGESIKLCFLWTPIATGLYEIKAYTSEISGDINSENNILIKYIYVGQTNSSGTGSARITFLIE